MGAQKANVSTKFYYMQYRVNKVLVWVVSEMILPC